MLATNVTLMLHTIAPCISSGYKKLAETRIGALIPLQYVNANNGNALHVLVLGMMSIIKLITRFHLTQFMSL